MWGMAMTKIKWVVTTGPAHVTVRVFSRTEPTETWAKNGDLTFDIKEWVTLLPQIPKQWEVESERYGP